MKKGFALALALVLLLSLTACGGTDPPAGSGNRLLEDLQSAIDGNSGESTGGAQAQAFENQIALSIDKTNYDKKERIEVTMDFGDVDKDNAVIVIVNSDMAHGELTPAEGKCEEYRWLSDFSEIPFYLSAPNKDGLFDVRVYAAGIGEELASVSFVVGNATLPTQPAVPPTEPPKDGGKLTKAFFNPPNMGYIKLTEKEDGEDYRNVTVGLLDGNYSLITEEIWDGGRIERNHDSAETKTAYVMGGDGVWYINQDYDGTLTEDKIVRELTVWLDTFYEETTHDGYSLYIKDHYIGTETLCNVVCDIYEIKDNGFGVYKKFWIDPSNGATLKYIEKGDGRDYEFELTQYSLLGPLWNNNLRPEPYSSARRP